MFRFKDNELIGADIGSSAVKIVQLRKNDGAWTVTAAGVADIPKTPEDDENRKEINTIRALKECLRLTGTEARMAVCSVSGPEVAVRSFNFPSLPQEEIEGAVLLEASQICPFNINDCAVSYQLISNGKDNSSGILVAATNKLIARKKYYAEHASLDAVLMDVDGLALLNCFSEIVRPGSDRSTAILNVGNSCANLAIIGKNSLPFVRDIACPGSEVAAKLASERALTTEDVKTVSAGDGQDQAPVELDEVFQTTFQELVAAVNDTLRYYTTLEKAVIEQILVCGGLSLVEGFVEWLGRQLTARTVLWNPAERMSCQPGSRCHDILNKKGPAMAVAMGLAMRTI